jgi:hypothetical protein
MFGKTSIPSNAIQTVDGGNLLHTVVWNLPCSYGTTILFDGYSNNISLKSGEHQRRSSLLTSKDIMFEDYSITTTTHAEFLANSHNKTYGPTNTTFERS